jgi:hypothetical protein
MSPTPLPERLRGSIRSAMNQAYLNIWIDPSLSAEIANTQQQYNL